MLPNVSNTRYFCLAACFAVVERARLLAGWGYYVDGRGNLWKRNENTVVKNKISICCKAVYNMDIHKSTFDGC